SMLAPSPETAHLTVRPSPCSPACSNRALNRTTSPVRTLVERGSMLTARTGFGATSIVFEAVAPSHCAWILARPAFDTTPRPAGSTLATSGFAEDQLIETSALGFPLAVLAVAANL